MARFYKEFPGEIHIYRNRMPRKDGGEAVLSLENVAAMAAGYTLFSLLIHFLNLAGGNPVGGWTLFRDAILAIFFLGLMAWFQERVVISLPKGTIHHALWRFSWGGTSLKKVTGISIEVGKSMGRSRLFYSLGTRKSRAAGIRLSPKARSMTYLAGYYHDIMPRLAALLAGSEAAGGEKPEAKPEVLDVEVESFVIADSMAEPQTGASPSE